MFRMNLKNNIPIIYRRVPIYAKIINRDISQFFLNSTSNCMLTVSKKLQLHFCADISSQIKLLFHKKLCQ